MMHIRSLQSHLLIISIFFCQLALHCGAVEQTERLTFISLSLLTTKNQRSAVLSSSLHVVQAINSMIQAVPYMIQAILCMIQATLFVDLLSQATHYFERNMLQEVFVSFLNCVRRRAVERNKAVGLGEALSPTRSASHPLSEGQETTTPMSSRVG